LRMCDTVGTWIYGGIFLEYSHVGVLKGHISIFKISS
jgi:hypothetical protein